MRSWDTAQVRPAFLFWAIAYFCEQPTHEPMEIRKRPHNPRSITEEQLKQLAAALEEFGDIGGITVNLTTGHIVTGNQRDSIIDFHAAKKIPVITHPEPQADGTTEIGLLTWKGRLYNYRIVDIGIEEEKEAIIYANKLGGTWDEEKLQQHWDKAILEEMGFNEWDYNGGPQEVSQDQDTTTNKKGTPQRDMLAGYLRSNLKKVEIIGSDAEITSVKETLEAARLKHHLATREEAALLILKMYADEGI